MTAPKKTIPIKKAPGTALMPWEAELAAAAVRQAAVEKPMGLFKQVQVQGGNMFIDDKPVPGNKLRAVVLAATHENQWFNRPYDPGVPAVPACYAFGDQSKEDPEAEMCPSPDVDERQGYPLKDDGTLDTSDGELSCANCWANRMGTADTGKGKACGNVRRLIITTEDALESPEKMKDAEARSFKVPVMSVRNWVAFVHEIEETMKRPYYGVIVEISTVPDKKSQWQVKFAFQELITFDEALYAALKKRVAAAAKDIVTPYPKLEEQEPPAKGGRGAKPAVKTGGKPTGPAQRKASKY